ncbi:hypothetical protein LTS18_003637 [Coniosporium uncinatum]|uniref:Uncharacterized protein n=1 Tax=Coniosporium uncinatum TaxID=93489 RepID=A0ACC3DSZ2_9PEZI|nr:hypothetical protein LTS18_003637 [Coniosporium uncinatum]
MPEPLKQEEVDSQTDPSVAKQYDTETPMSQQWSEFYGICDKLKVGLLGTHRNNVPGMVFRSMATAKRTGPDFLFLANHHSHKFEDLDNDKDVTITFQNNSNQDWVSINGTATTVDNSDPRIKELHNGMVKAWFGDLGDGKHDGSADDPRMSLIEVKSKYITYWKAQVGTLGMMKEVGMAALTGKVANTGATREFHQQDIETERQAPSE